VPESFNTVIRRLISEHHQRQNVKMKKINAMLVGDPGLAKSLMLKESVNCTGSQVYWKNIQTRVQYQAAANT